MAFGPGKYDEITEHVRKVTRAHGVILIVLGGEKGDGFEVQFEAPPNVGVQEIADSVPGLLRQMATEIERTNRRGQS